MRILFLRIGLKDIFALFKIRDLDMIYPRSERLSDFAIMRGFYLHESPYRRI